MASDPAVGSEAGSLGTALRVRPGAACVPRSTACPRRADCGVSIRTSTRCSRRHNSALCQVAQRCAGLHAERTCEAGIGSLGQLRRAHRSDYRQSEREDHEEWRRRSARTGCCQVPGRKRPVAEDIERNPVAPQVRRNANGHCEGSGWALDDVVDRLPRSPNVRKPLAERECRAAKLRNAGGAGRFGTRRDRGNAAGRQETDSAIPQTID